MSNIEKIIGAYSDALETHIYDAGNGEVVPAEENDLVIAAQLEFEHMQDALDALLLAYAKNHDGNGKIDWDDLGEAFEQARKCRPGKYEALVRELGGDA